MCYNSNTQFFEPKVHHVNKDLFCLSICFFPFNYRSTKFEGGGTHDI